jgi:predicted XRE-type DNA-binding protein
MTEQNEIEFEVSSGNVFADLGYADAEDALAKAKLAAEIGAIIDARGLTQTQAAGMLGLTQPNVSDLARGRLRGFSLERLVHCLLALQRNVDIVVSESPRPHTTGHVNVVLKAARNTRNKTPVQRTPRTKAQTTRTERVTPALKKGRG